MGLIVARFCTSSISNSARRSFMNGSMPRIMSSGNSSCRVWLSGQTPPQPQPREFGHQRVHAQCRKETDEESDDDHRMRTQRSEDLAMPDCGDREYGEQYVT